METAAARKPDEKIKPRPAQLKTVVLSPSNRSIWWHRRVALRHQRAPGSPMPRARRARKCCSEDRRLPLPIPKIFLVVYLLKLSSECLVSYDPHFPANDGTNKFFIFKLFPTFLKFSTSKSG